MSAPRRHYVNHTRMKGVIRVRGFVLDYGVEMLVFVADIAPCNARTLSKYKMTIKRALQLRDQQ